MNNEEIINEIMKLIEEKEKELQADKLLLEKDRKNDIVKIVLNKLEEVVTDEN